jgi:hypothetical protein
MMRGHQTSPCVKISGFFLFSAIQQISGYDKNEKELAKPASKVESQIKRSYTKTCISR